MQELEKILEEIKKEAICISSYYVCEKFRDREDLYVTLSDVKDIIRKHINDGWIPVEERLPAEGEEVLITTDVGLIATGYIHCFEWITGEEPDYPIAWRPLPEPYRPERMDQNEKAHNQD